MKTANLVLFVAAALVLAACGDGTPAKPDASAKPTATTTAAATSTAAATATASAKGW